MNRVFAKIISVVAGAAMAIGVGFAVANNKSNKVEAASGDELTIQSYASSHSWVNSTAYTTVNYDSFITLTGATGGNNCKYYSSNFSWRHYEGDSGAITITATGGAALTSAVFNFSVGNGGCLKYNTTNYSSGQSITLTGLTTATFTVAHSSGSKNGNVQITSIQVAYSTANVPELTGLRIANDSQPTKKVYDAGERFDPAGLVIQAQFDDEWDTENNVVNDVEWAPNPLTAGLTSVTGTYEYNSVSKTVEVSGLTVKAPDFVHTYASNSVYNQTSGSDSQVRTFKPASGPEYITLGGYNYTSGQSMSFINKDGLYLGNNEEYVVEGDQKYIRKIIVYCAENNYANKLSMTEGTTVLPTTTVVEPTISSDSKTFTYVFSSGSTFFKLSKSSTSYVNLTRIEVFVGDTIYAKDLIANNISTQASLAFSNYNRTGQAIIDTLSRGTTGITDGAGYGDWSNKTCASSAVYAGQSAGGNNSIQLRSDNNNSGIVTTASGGYAKKITVVWDSHTATDRTLMVLGKNTPYTAATDLFANETVGVWIGNIVCGTSTTLTINGDYEYIGFRSNSGAMYIKSISIQWGEVKYTFENLGIRFTGSVSESMWTRLNNESTIEGYGMLLSTAAFLGANPLKNYYESADGTDVKIFDNENTVHDPVFKPEPTLKDGNYIWNLFKVVNFNPQAIYTANFQYVAVAFIRLANDEVVFLKEQSTSVRRLAIALIESGERDENSLGGSINYLANL